MVLFYLKLKMRKNNVGILSEMLVHGDITTATSTCMSCTDTVTQECNSNLILIPPGCTPLVQPMDVSINHPFKARMQELWVAWFHSYTSVTHRGNLKQPTRQDAINWVSILLSLSKMKELVM